MAAQVIQLDSKRHYCDGCRFLRVVRRPSAFGSGECVHRLCGARPFPKKLDIQDKDLAYKRCFGLNDTGTCKKFRPQYREAACGKKAAAQ